MKFPKLSITNFLAITEAEINLADRGLVLIQGRNTLDTSSVSNGAGKSTIADALCWALFGVTARGASADDVINHTAKKGTKVEVQVVDGAHTYTIARHRKHKTGKNTLTVSMNDGLRDTDLTKGTDKLTQDVVDKIIGSSLEVFAGSIYAGQEKMPDLPSLTDKALKMLIEEAAGVLVLEAAYKQAREDMTRAKNDVEMAVVDLDHKETDLANIDSHLTAAQTMAMSWETERTARVATLKTEVNTNVVPKLRETMADLGKTDLGVVETKISECDAKIAGVQSENERLVELNQAIATAESTAITASNHTRAEGEEDAQLAHKVDLLKREVLALTHTENVARAELSRLARAVTEIEHKIGCPCDECGRPMTEKELGAAKAAAQERHDAQAKHLAEIVLKDLEAKKNEELKASNALIAFREQLAKTVTERRDAAGEAVRAAREARDAFKGSMTDISTVSAHRAALLAERGRIHGLVTERDRLTVQARSYKERIEQAQSEPNPHEPNIAHWKKQRAEAAEAIEVVEKRLEKLQEQLAIETEVVKVYAPSGVRARILDEVTPFLNAQTSKYLGTLSDGNIEAVWSTLTLDAKGNPKEKFAIDVTNAHGGGIFKLQSGGEKRKVRIATALALQDLVATRATKPIDLFVGDEIDDALDPAGIERLTQVLEEKARERGSVFIISHNEIQDFVRNVLTIEKTASGTVITESAA